MSEEYVPGWAEASAQRWEESVAHVVERLRDMADAVERRTTPRKSLDTLRPDYLTAYQEIVHEVHWGLANASLAPLVRIAREAQQAQDRKPEEAPT